VPDEWRVLTSQAVLDRWAALPSYSQRHIVAYWEWVEDVNRDGPPAETVRVFGDDELLLAGIPGTALVVSFFASVHDRVIVVKEIA
jgi:hypothetical protein